MFKFQTGLLLLMPYTDNNGIKIYYRIEGKGPPIIMLPGFLGTTESLYRDSYVDSLKNNYKLVLIDRRGHGLSDKPHDPKDYLQKHLVSDIIAVMDDLDIDKAHFWGYSFGTYIGLILAKHHPNRFHTFIIGGGSPQKLDLDHQLEQLFSLRESMKQGAEAFIASFEKEGTEVTPEEKETVRRWDFKALYASLVVDDLFQDMDRHLPELDTPFLFYAGEEDSWSHHERQVDFSKKMKNAQVFGIPNRGHEVNGEKELILPRVLQFLQEFSPISQSPNQ
ncbi:MAG: alpha/beta fold hydrolase [Candidatus Kariarchaeaceae archaeon]